MPKQTERQKSAKRTMALDVIEAWLEKQKARPVRAKPGFISVED